MLKNLTLRPHTIDRETIEKFVASLPLDPAARKSLKNLTPRGYIGLAEELVERFCPQPPGGKAV